MRHSVRGLLAALIVSTAAAPVPAQTAALTAPTRARAAAKPARPFSVGERFSYDVHYGPVKVGSGSIEILDVQNVRGRGAWRALFRLKGGNSLYRLDNTFKSWIDTSTLASLRFHKDVREGKRERAKAFEIYEELGLYREEGKGEFPTVAGPLDDASFFYFVRTIPLEVGKAYAFNRYFKPDRNPVGVTVLRRERLTTDVGTFDAIVIRPVIKTSGMLAEARKTEVWLSDDPRRLVLRVRSELPFGSVTMDLQEYRPGDRPAILAER
jgi:hypothetical protein